MSKRATWRLSRFLGEEHGASMVEFSVIAGFYLAIVGGLIDFANGFYQWNSATKALQQGARLAAVSDPVASDLASMTGLEGSALAGDPFPDFIRVCSGAARSCSGGTFSQQALETIVYGRNRTSCTTLGAGQTPAMCHVFGRIRPENVVITYQSSGLGFAGRPGGPVPTITVELTGLTFEFAFLNGVMGFNPIPMPSMKTTATGEDMRTTWSAS